MADYNSLKSSCPPEPLAKQNWEESPSSGAGASSGVEKPKVDNRDYSDNRIELSSPEPESVPNDMRYSEQQEAEQRDYDRRRDQVISGQQRGAKSQPEEPPTEMPKGEGGGATPCRRKPSDFAPPSV